ncbi:MAG: hypothetical protein IJF83_05610 [Methanobrevibacter sp.]|nr:hypothetical protein [Methanobrevibacter sp.]
MIDNNNFKIHKKGSSIYLRNNDDEKIGPFAIYYEETLNEILEVLNTSELRICTLSIYNDRKDEKIKELTEENLILRGPKHRRFGKHTIDNWEAYIIDNYTGEKYGADIDKLLLLLNTLTDKWMNDKLKDTEKIMKRYYSMYNSVDPTFGEIIRLISKDLGVSI